MQRHFFLCFLFFALLVPSYSSAQSSPSLNLTLEPQFPEIGEQYTVSAHITRSASPRTSLVWLVNGSAVDTAKDSDTVTLTGYATPAQITARAVFADGTVTEAKKTVSPVRVDLIVSADTRTPLFYGGRSLPSNGSSFSVNALVFKNNTQQHNLAYRWSIDGKKQGNSAVRGQNTVTYTPSFESEVIVTVEVFDAQNQKIAEDSVVVPVVTPELYFYEHNPLRGLSQVSLLDPHIFVGDEMNIRAEAYYLNAAIDPAQLLTEWKIDGTQVRAGANKQELAIRKDGQTGSSKVSFHIRDLKQLLHGVQKTLTINF